MEITYKEMNTKVTALPPLPSTSTVTIDVAFSLWTKISGDVQWAHPSTAGLGHHLFYELYLFWLVGVAATLVIFNSQRMGLIKAERHQTEEVAQSGDSG